MAEFPPNLDDGELWIPSDILLPPSPPLESHSHVDHHARRSITTPTLLPSSQTPRLFRPASPSAPSMAAPNTHLFGLVPGPGSSSSIPAQLFHHQVVSVPQPPQNQLGFSLPFQRQCGGTGVFLPRAASGNFGRRNHGARKQKMGGRWSVRQRGQTTN